MLTIERLSRAGLVCTLLVITIMSSALSGSAAGQESLSDLRARMDHIQGELDATTARIEGLRSEQEEVRDRISEIEVRLDDLADETARLQKTAVERARSLYLQGPTGAAEVLLEAQSFGQLYDRAEVLARVSGRDTEIFLRLSRSRAELEDLSVELEDRRVQLHETSEDLAAAGRDLREQLASVSSEYEALKAKLAAAEAAPDPVPRGPEPKGPAPAPVQGSGKACPVAGAVSFVDSWGAPRDGHTHVGVDMMADYGTPVVAIVSGTVSSGTSSSGGNMIFLSGEDGNSYWYLHNQQNLVTSGSVRVGQQIATVGDTGNATGIPHVHFEYHPGGGGAVHPYPVVASIC